MGMLAGELMKLGFLLTLLAFGVWVGSASVAAWVAWEKGRDPVAWFVVAFFLSPLVALIALGAVSARHVARVRAPRPVALADRKRFDESVVVAPPPVAGAHPEEKRWAMSGAGGARRSW